MSRKLPQVIMTNEPQGTYVQVALSYGGTVPGLYYTMAGGAERRTLVMSSGHPRPYRQTGNFFQASEHANYLARTQNVSMVQPVGIFGQQFRADGMVAVLSPSGYVGEIPKLSLPSVAAAASAAFPYQAIGWNRTRPTRPVANLITALGELAKDGLPRIPGLILGDALKRLPHYAAAKASGYNPGRRVGRSLGSEYLNYDFGWRPMIDDALKLLDFQRKFQQRIDRWRRANGRLLRSRITLLDENTTTVERTWTNDMRPFLTVGGFGSWQGNANVTSYYSRKVWFAAGYRIRLPAIMPANLGLIQAGLLGGLPTPSQIWDLMPWSWMLDWFGNVGDVLQNLYDPLGFAYAAHYACIMQRTETNREFTCSATQTNAAIRGTSSVTVGANYRVVSKYRSAALPYGFGLTWEGMSARQLATAAALGISRA